jgi:hypothetical protein
MRGAQQMLEPDREAERHDGLKTLDASTLAVFMSVPMAVTSSRQGYGPFCSRSNQFRYMKQMINLG